MGEILVQPWQPIKWKPVYDLMVSMHVMGYSNVEIGRQVDYSPIQVGNILRSDAAQEIVRQFHLKMNAQSIEELPAKMEKMKRVAFRRIEETLDNEELAIKNPFAVANTAMSFLKGIGSLSDGSPKVQNNINLPVPVGHMKDLIDALRESSQIEKVTDGDFEIIVGPDGAGGKTKQLVKSAPDDATSEGS